MSFLMKSRKVKAYCRMMSCLNEVVSKICEKAYAGCYNNKFLFVFIIPPFILAVLSSDTIFLLKGRATFPKSAVGSIFLRIFHTGRFYMYTNFSMTVKERLRKHTQQGGAQFAPDPALRFLPELPCIFMHNIDNGISIFFVYIC